MCGVLAPIKNDKDSFPVPSYPRDFQTCNKADYGADLTQHVRTKPVRPAESGPLLPQDAVTPQFTSQARADFPAHSREAVRELRSGRAGQSASHAPGYNIITGGNALGNNVFEQWQDTDYRRHR
ncbi:uncharacterized protein HaLaN_16555 [Haematococcus lacustris]|uniref:Uncharacterized protein n=1 Tax=Haematococcus lacustris TaxID=44745 RepID=A0A699ZJ72_HAELA|nr:uncharacterized protein HaLaN_16555 [Haematococcus lacustris]